MSKSTKLVLVISLLCASMISNLLLLHMVLSDDGLPRMQYELLDQNSGRTDIRTFIVDADGKRLPHGITVSRVWKSKVACEGRERLTIELYHKGELVECSVRVTDRPFGPDEDRVPCPAPPKNSTGNENDGSEAESDIESPE